MPDGFAAKDIDALYAGGKVPTTAEFASVLRKNTKKAIPAGTPDRELVHAFMSQPGVKPYAKNWKAPSDYNSKTAPTAPASPKSPGGPPAAPTAGITETAKKLSGDVQIPSLTPGQQGQAGIHKTFETMATKGVKAGVREAFAQEPEVKKETKEEAAKGNAVDRLRNWMLGSPTQASESEAAKRRAQVRQEVAKAPNAGYAKSAQFGIGIAEGFSQKGIEFADPKNAAMLYAFARLDPAKYTGRIQKAIKIARIIAVGGLTAQGLQGLKEEVPEAFDAFQKGDYEQAGNLTTQAVIDGLITAKVGKETMKDMPAPVKRLVTALSETKTRGFREGPELGPSKPEGLYPSKPEGLYPSKPDVTQRGELERQRVEREKTAEEKERTEFNKAQKPKLNRQETIEANRERLKDLRRQEEEALYTVGPPDLEKLKGIRAEIKTQENHLKTLEEHYKAATGKAKAPAKATAEKTPAVEQRKNQPTHRQGVTPGQNAVSDQEMNARIWDEYRKGLRKEPPPGAPPAAAPEPPKPPEPRPKRGRPKKSATSTPATEKPGEAPPTPPQTPPQAPAGAAAPPAGATTEPPKPDVQAEIERLRTENEKLKAGQAPPAMAAAQEESQAKLQAGVEEAKTGQENTQKALDVLDQTKSATFDEKGWQALKDFLGEETGTSNMRQLFNGDESNPKFKRLMELVALSKAQGLNDTQTQEVRNLLKEGMQTETPEEKAYREAIAKSAPKPQGGAVQQATNFEPWAKELPSTPVVEQKAPNATVEQRLKELYDKQKEMGQLSPADEAEMKRLENRTIKGKGAEKAPPREKPTKPKEEEKPKSAVEQEMEKLKAENKMLKKLGPNVEGVEGGEAGEPLSADEEKDIAKVLPEDQARYRELYQKQKTSKAPAGSETLTPEEATRAASLKGPEFEQAAQTAAPRMLGTKLTEAESQEMREIEGRSKISEVGPPPSRAAFNTADEVVVQGMRTGEKNLTVSIFDPLTGKVVDEFQFNPQQSGPGVNEQLARRIEKAGPGVQVQVGNETVPVAESAGQERREKAARVSRALKQIEAQAAQKKGQEKVSGEKLDKAIAELNSLFEKPTAGEPGVTEKELKKQSKERVKPSLKPGPGAQPTLESTPIPEARAKAGKGYKAPETEMDRKAAEFKRQEQMARNDRDNLDLAVRGLKTILARETPKEPLDPRYKKYVQKALKNLEKKSADVKYQQAVKESAFKERQAQLTDKQLQGETQPKLQPHKSKWAEKGPATPQWRIDMEDEFFRLQDFWKSEEGTSKVGQAIRNRFGQAHPDKDWWIGPAKNLLVEDTHSESAQKYLNRKHAKGYEGYRSHVDAMLDQDFVRVAANGVELNVKAMSGKHFYEAIQKAVENARGRGEKEISISVHLPKPAGWKEAIPPSLHIWVPQDDLGDFLRNPRQYFRKYGQNPDERYQEGMYGRGPRAAINQPPANREVNA